MQNLVPIKRIQNLTKQQKDALLGLIIVLLVAVIYYFQWAYYLTGLEGSKVSIDQPERYFWWANDSRSYREAGEWLFGRVDSDAIADRPWLYPFMLGLARTLFASNAESVLWVGQFLMWLASGLFIYFALQNGTRSTVLSMVGTGIFLSHPSPLVLTFHGMSESLNIVLVATFCWVLTISNEKRVYFALLLLALLTVVKPIYLFVLILFIIYLLIKYKKTTPLKQIGLVVFLLIPIWIQLLLSFIATGKPTISNIGAYTFKNYFVADVHLTVEKLEWRESMQKIESWGLEHQLHYLQQHKREAALAFRRHIIDSNLWTGSFFTLGEGNRMTDFASTANAISAYLHLLMLPLIIYYLASAKYWKNKITITLLYFCFIIQLLTTGISTGQQDRLIVTAMPLWIVAYLLSYRGLKGREKVDPYATSATANSA